MCVDENVLRLANQSTWSLSLTCVTACPQGGVPVRGGLPDAVRRVHVLRPAHLRHLPRLRPRHHQGNVLTVDWISKYRTAAVSPFAPFQLARAKDQVLPLLVMETLGMYPGLPGLFVAGVFSAALRHESPLPLVESPPGR